MDPYLRDVLDVLLRMLHVTAGIAWIGASFYFVRLDLALRPPKRAEDAEAGVAGEFWGVHGGGLYHSQKYRLAPGGDARAAALVQVGGVHDVALRVRALRRPLLHGRRYAAHRSVRRRPLDRRGDGAQRRRHRPRLGRLRRSSAGRSGGGARSRSQSSARASSRSQPGPPASSSPRGPRTCRSA